MKKFAVKLLTIVLSLMMVMTVGACTNTASSEGITLTVWESENNIEHATKILENFKVYYKSLYPSAPEINFEFEAYGEAVTIEKLGLYGPTGEGADILSFVHDKLGVAVQEDLLAQNVFAEEYKATHRADAVAAGSIDDKLYGYPITAESQVIIYHKGRVTAQQASTVEGLLAAGKKVLWKIKDGFYSFSLFSDAVLYGADGDDAATVDFNRPKTVANISAVVSDANFNNIVIEDVNKAVSLIQDSAGADRIDAVITTPYLQEQVVAAIGAANVGIAKLPTLKGEELKPYSGYKMYGVNRYSTNPAISHMVAQYLTNYTSQKYRMVKMGLLPTMNTADMLADIGKTENMSVFLNSLELSRVMPNITAMGSKYWQNIENTMTSIINTKPNSSTIATNLGELSALVRA